jgi:hypothetical protein
VLRHLENANALHRLRHVLLLSCPRIGSSHYRPCPRTGRKRASGPPGMDACAPSMASSCFAFHNASAAGSRTRTLIPNQSAHPEPTRTKVLIPNPKCSSRTKR